jgi:hypothetical protein
MIVKESGQEFLILSIVASILVIRVLKIGVVWVHLDEEKQLTGVETCTKDLLEVDKCKLGSDLDQIILHALQVHLLPV